MEAQNMYERIKEMTIDEMVQHHIMYAATLFIAFNGKVPDTIFEKGYFDLLKESLTQTLEN